MSRVGERTLLKNLGMWLGKLTIIARDMPIKRRNLAVKELLLEGYDTSRFIVVIPFVCKVVEQCLYSSVFRPPNPWLTAIMSCICMSKGVLQWMVSTLKNK